ncbi:hypothetical protein TNCT_292321 [Trichonephila clavata]|uniref:Uncharacterized protein n=1 Tax=Trichonephila clavata TaxID=2740835 RepID=A0A8X6G748_TRICU|nr:hypothetical protein TNCT_292321 [Trichonephila clavata]
MWKCVFPHRILFDRFIVSRVPLRTVRGIENSAGRSSEATRGPSVEWRHAAKPYTFVVRKCEPLVGGFVVGSRRSRCLRRSLWEISEIGELLGVRCLSYELSRWAARGRRAREETSLPGSGSTYRALRGKCIVVSGPLGEGPIFKNPGSRAWSRRACGAREKPHPYAPFVGRLRRLRGSFRWVRVKYGVASGRRDRGKRNNVKIHTYVVGCVAETVTQDAPRSHDEEFLGCGVILLPTV